MRLKVIGVSWDVVEIEIAEFRQCFPREFFEKNISVGDEFILVKASFLDKIRRELFDLQKNLDEVKDHIDTEKIFTEYEIQEKMKQ